jgi:sterol desaturase/sphingolipid hydroxylase (fatty acid hydroxylase superfamily)
MLELAALYGWKFLTFTVWPKLFGALSLASIGAAAEFLLPHERQSWRSYARGAGLLLIYVLIGGALFLLMRRLMASVQIRPLISLDFTGSYLLGIAAPLLVLLIADFFYYWVHRMQHVVPTLWRFHRVHHSIRELNAVNCQHHPLEELLQLALIVTPVVILIDVSYNQTLVALVLARVFGGALTHSNSRLSLGPLRYLFAEPVYHRLHHSIDPRHFDRNFAAQFPIWDVLFGTSLFPRKGETIRTGVAGYDEAATPSQYLLARHSADRPTPAQPCTDPYSQRQRLRYPV